MEKSFTQTPSLENLGYNYNPKRGFCKMLKDIYKFEPFLLLNYPIEKKKECMDNLADFGYYG